MLFPYSTSYVADITTKCIKRLYQNVAIIMTKFYYQNKHNHKMLFIVITIMIISVIVRIERFLLYQTKVPSLSVASINNSTRSNSLIQCANGNCDMAYTDSYGFFDDITNEAWQHKKYITTTLFPSWYIHPLYPSINHNGNTKSGLHWFGFNVHPMFNCDYITRIGGYGDGGKFVCDVHRLANDNKKCLIYSIGSSNDDFENDIQKQISSSSLRPWDTTTITNPMIQATTEQQSVNQYPCEIHIFDPNPIYEQNVTNNNIFYQSWGIQTNTNIQIMGVKNRNIRKVGGGKKNRNMNNKFEHYYTFQETLQKLNHTNRHIDILKIDCNGCEWSIYNDILSRHSDSITQILIKLYPNHNRPNDVTFPKFFNTLRNYHYIPYYREPNPIDGIIHEYSFIKLRNFYPDIDDKSIFTRLYYQLFNGLKWKN